jgi:hypothetical protein
MLYKLGQTNGIFDSLEAVPFQSVPLEKHLEDLLANSLLDVLFEGNELMPIFQERSQQAEADIYALNKQGDLVIFELKRDGAGSDAVHQALRYCETAAHWNYERLQEMLATYNKEKATDLQEEHQKSFSLEHPLEKSAFNTRQRLIVVGNAASENLIRNVDYWKSKGLLIDFIPYRIYALKNGDQKEHYFEFFSIPYDKHSNPAHIKGVLFDTCRSHRKDSIWYMCEKDRVAAFDDQAHVVSYLGKNDIVFLYHKREGIIAAGRITSGVKDDVYEGAKYHDLEWLTAKPVNGAGPLKAMSPRIIKKVLGHDFFWARTIKTPYLSKSESEKLLEALILHIGPKA